MLQLCFLVATIPDNTDFIARHVAESDVLSYMAVMSSIAHRYDKSNTYEDVISSVGNIGYYF